MKKVRSPRKKPSTKTKSSKKTKRPPKPSGRKRKSSRAPVAYLGLGSNVGDSIGLLGRAVAEIARVAPVRRISSLYRSEPVGFRDQPDFWNAALEISWEGSPEDLLARLQAIERRLGRLRRFAGGPREIDIDILDLSGLVRSEPDPVLPHPRLESRRFALLPLAEIAPRWTHPVSGKSTRELLAGLASTPRVWKVETGRWGAGETEK